jgi:hypothetical protein
MTKDEARMPKDANRPKEVESFNRLTVESGARVNDSTIERFNDLP